MNTDSDELLNEFASGRLVRPDWTKPNPVALARAISALGGYSPWGEDQLVTEIGQRLGQPDHTVVVIADGFGVNFVRGLPEDSFSRKHLAWEQPAVFPPSTGPNLTSLHSGEYPAKHGFVGWWVYLPRISGRATVYDWVRWSDGKNLTSVGLAPGDVFLSEPYPGKLNIDCKLFTESALNDSMPTLHSLAGGAPGEGFDDIGEGFEKVAQRVQEAGSRTLTLLYWDRVDQFAHRFGVSAPETTGAVSELDKALKELANALAGKARVLVTADHGHLDVSKYVQLDEDHSLSKLLKCTQSGDDRFNYFHVRDGHVERFAEEFLSEFGEDSFLLSTDELIEMRLLGPEPPTPEVRERLGDFTSISRNASAFTWRAPDNLAGAQRSSHGGFSADEMMVPVLLA